MLLSQWKESNKSKKHDDVNYVPKIEKNDNILEQELDAIKIIVRKINASLDVTVGRIYDLSIYTLSIVFTFIGIIKTSIQVIELLVQIDLEMGNSPSGLRLLGNGKFCSYHIKLDNAATITVTKHQEKTEDQEKSKKSQKWELKYDVDGMTCTLSISRTTQRNSGDEDICISVTDLIQNIQKHSTVVRPQSALLHVVVEKEEKNDGFLCEQYSLWSRETTETQYGVSRRGEVETQYWAYGCGTRMGLLVLEKKKKKINEKLAYMATVAHYYVNSASGRNCDGDIGFSVVVKIGVMSHNGQLDFSVDGPVEHPSSALRYMIEEVIRTGTWKLSACPHCKNIQSQRRWVSESEDSDTPLPPPPPRCCGGSQHAANMGRFNGDGNGSIIQATKVNFNKWWK